jgi:hypothetical protein
MVTATRVRNGATAALISATAGAVGVVAIILFDSIGQPFGTMAALAGLVMLVSLAPVMLAHYELGGVVPLWPARLALGGALAVLAGWAVMQVAFVLSQPGTDVAAVRGLGFQQAATGASAAQAALLAGVALWVAGASLLAGTWLPGLVRTLGIVAGLGVLLMAVGLLVGGSSNAWTNLGAAAYQILLPVWAFLLGRVFARHVAATMAAREAVAA